MAESIAATCAKAHSSARLHRWRIDETCANLTDTEFEHTLQRQKEGKSNI